MTALQRNYPCIFWLLCLLAFATNNLWPQQYPADVIEEWQWPCEEDSGIEDPLVLDLPTAISLVVEANRNLANALDGIKKAQLQVQLSQSDFSYKAVPSGDAGYAGGGEAGFGMTLGGGLDLRKKFYCGTSISINPYINRNAKHYHAGVKAVFTQPLLKGFGQEYNLANVYAALYANRAALRTAYLAGIDAVNHTIQALYEVVRQEELGKVERQAYERIKKFCDVIAVKERIGLADSLDVYRAEIELSHTEESLNNAIEKLQDAKDALRDVLSLPLDTPIIVSVPTDYEPIVLQVDEAIDIALQNRYEIAQAEDQVQEAIRLARAAKTKLSPDLNLVVDFTNTGRDEVFTNAFTTKRDSRWGVGFTTSTDWDRTTQKVAYEQSLLSIASAERNLKQVKNNIVLEIKRIMRTAGRAEQRIESQEKQMQRSLGELKLARLKFDRGFANNFDVIQAEKNLRTAQVALLTAQLDHKITQYRVRTSLGLLVDKPEICQ